MSRVRSPYWPCFFFELYCRYSIGNVRWMDFVPGSLDGLVHLALTPSWWISRCFSIQIKFIIFIFEIVFWTYWIEKGNIVIEINKFFAQIPYFVQVALFSSFQKVLFVRYIYGFYQKDFENSFLNTGRWKCWQVRFILIDFIVRNNCDVSRINIQPIWYLTICEYLHVTYPGCIFFYWA